MSQRTSPPPDVRRVTGRAPSDPDRSSVPSAAYSPARSSPAFPRLPLRQLLDSAGLAVSCAPAHPDCDTDTLLLTPPGAVGPRLAVKIPRTQSAVAAVEREARMLVEIRRFELGHLRDTIPRFVQLCEQDGRTVLMTSAVPGRVLGGAFCGMWDVSHARCRSDELDVAGAWLARFQEMTARGSGPLDLLPRDLLERLERRAAASGRGDDTRTAVDRAHRVQELLARHVAPRSAVHGNFRADQVLVHARTAEVSGVLGWRAATTRGEPLADLGRFAVTHSRHRASRGNVPGRTVLAGHGRDAERVRRFITQGLVRLGLPESLGYPVAWAATASLLAGIDVGVDPRRAAMLTRLLARTPDPTVGR